MKTLFILIISLVPLLSWGEVDRVTLLKPTGEVLGDITAKDVCRAWEQAFVKPDTPYKKLTDPVSMPSPLVGVVFWTKGVPVGSAQILCYDSIVSSEKANSIANGTKVEVPLTYVIGRNKELTRLVLGFLKKQARGYLENFDRRKGLPPKNLWEEAGLKAEQAAPSDGEKPPN